MYPVSFPARLAATAALLAAALSACAPTPRLPRSSVCTEIGCGSSFEVALVGQYVPTVFTMMITTETGEFVNIRCTDGNAEFEPPEAGRWAPTCPAGGVTLQDFAPQRASVQLNWAEGETQQEFEPQYTESRPNGPGCEPSCRSTRIEVIIPEVPPYGDESTWAEYADPEHGFSIRYPEALGLELGPRSDGYGFAYIGDRIWIRVTWRDPLVCQGECPIIENTERVSVAGREAQRAQGYIGSVGGNIPQYFLVYLFRSGSDFVSFELYAESRHAQLGDPSVIVPLKQADIDLFERMMQTLEFTNQ